MPVSIVSGSDPDIDVLSKSDNIYERLVPSRPRRIA